MKTQYFLFVTLLSLIGEPLFSQEKSCLNYPLQFSLVHPVGTNGGRSTDYRYHFSLNLLTGSTCGITGLELAGLLNRNKEDVTGCQVAGLGNFTDGNVKGLQLGGIYGIAGLVTGVQVSGILNRSKMARGAQVAGIANLNEGNSKGVQIAGITNINNGNTKGAQIAGIYNKTKALRGIQIGLINVSDTVEKGIPIGLINIVKKGYYDEWVFSVADYQNIGFSYKSGSKALYNIYSIGMNFLEEELWIYGLGFGHRRDLNSSFSFQPELMVYTYLPQDFKKVRDTYSAHFKFGFVSHLSDKLAVNFAPSIYGSIKSNHGKYRRYGYDESPVNSIMESRPAGSNSKIAMGVGLSLGIVFK